MDSYLESVLGRYVIATLTTPTTYLIFKDENITFTKQISRATKTAGWNTANAIKNEFYAYTGRTDIELAILPIKISYELLKEDKDYKIEGNKELLSFILIKDKIRKEKLFIYDRYRRQKLLTSSIYEKSNN